jgi:hypothetical protein
MARRTSRAALALGTFALTAALAPAPQAPDKAGPLKELAEARVKVCERMLDFYRESFKAPPAAGVAPQSPADRYAANYEPLELWSRRLADARLDLASRPDERVAILLGEVDRIRKFSGDLREMARAEPEWRIVSDKVEFYQLDAEYRLAKEKAGR